MIEAVGRVLLGKEHQVRLAFSCLLAGGHLLIEDRPGMGKSTLAEALARVFALAFKRVSFTSDLLPADLTGLNVFNPAEASFRFQPGPLFTQVLLADEINRASPRTQSALLEAMAAGRVSVDGVSHGLPEPFFVIATVEQRPGAGSCQKALTGPRRETGIPLTTDLHQIKDVVDQKLRAVLGGTTVLQLLQGLRSQPMQ